MTTLLYDYFSYDICSVLPLITNKEVIFSRFWGMIHFEFSSSLGKRCRQRPLPWRKYISHRKLPTHTYTVTVWNCTSQPFPVSLPYSFFTLASLTSFQENPSGLFTLAFFHVNNPSFSFHSFSTPSEENTEPGWFFFYYDVGIPFSAAYMPAWARSKILLCWHRGRKPHVTLLMLIYGLKILQGAGKILLVLFNRRLSKQLEVHLKSQV